MAFWVIIPASGLGTRFSEKMPKQYISLLGKTIIEHTLNLFIQLPWVQKMVIPIAIDDSKFNQLPISLNPKVQTVIGGETRAASVHNAMRYLQDKAKPNDWILVHDAVRPCLHQDDLKQLISQLQDDDVGGILATKVSDTLKLSQNHKIVQTIPRTHVWQAQTPQMFRYKVLFDALSWCQENNHNITDEASALEAVGFNPTVVQAKHLNPKLTFEQDLKLITMMLKLCQQEEYSS